MLLASELAVVNKDGARPAKRACLDNFSTDSVEWLHSTSPSPQTQYAKENPGNSLSTIEFCYLAFQSIEEKSYSKAETILDQAWKNRSVVASHDRRPLFARRLEKELQDEQR